MYVHSGVHLCIGLAGLGSVARVSQRVTVVAVRAPQMSRSICAYVNMKIFVYIYVYTCIHVYMYIYILLQPIAFGGSFLQSQISIDALVL